MTRDPRFPTRYPIAEIAAQIERALGNDTQVLVADVVLAMLTTPPWSRMPEPSNETIHELTSVVVATVENVKHAAGTVVQRWYIVERGGWSHIVPVEHLTADEIAESVVTLAVAATLTLIAEQKKPGGQS